MKRRLIPKLQLILKQTYNGKKPILVLTKQFSGYRPVGDVISQAKIFEAQLADEIVLVDLIGNDESWPILLDTVQLISEVLATPLSVGGGLKDLDQIQALLNRGADKVIINTGAIEDPELINRASSLYGSQCITLSIDAIKKEQDTWLVFKSNGSINTGIAVIDWAKEVVERGAGEILITSIINDGGGNGLDLELIQSIVRAVNVPIIASGGCGIAKHFVDGYKVGASGIASGTYFFKRDQNPIQCRSHIANSGIPIRLSLFSE